MSRSNLVKVEAREAAHRYRTALQRMGRNVHVTVRGTRILIGLQSYDAAQVTKMADELEARTRRDEELARSFG